MYDADQSDYEMESEDANDASVVAPLLPRLIRNLPARGRIAQAPSPIAGTSHSMAVDTREGEDNQFSDPDDEDEYAPAVKRARTNSGKAVGKQGKGKASEQKRRAVESDPPACKWEKRAGRYACLWPGCEHSVKTASGIGRHWKGHLEIKKQPCPAGCGEEFIWENFVVKRHLQGDKEREPACTASDAKRLKGLEAVLALIEKNSGGAKKSAKSPKAGKPGKSGRA
ncbi:hypothetical protein DFH06DRAFT_1249632 [Mycena polygramma]|nr:hypothetical protein DFH06DRAFT_1249632 [Mycena polygramma]